MPCAFALGVTLGGATTGTDDPTNETALFAAATAIYAPPPLGAEGQAVVLLDYNRRYERDVLGKQDPPDWKNGNSRYDPQGERLSGPAPRGLRYLVVELDANGTLVIHRDRETHPDDRLIA